MSDQREEIRLAEGLRNSEEAQLRDKYLEDYDAALSALATIRKLLEEDAEYWRKRRQWWRFW